MSDDIVFVVEDEEGEERSSERVFEGEELLQVVDELREEYEKAEGEIASAKRKWDKYRRHWEVQPEREKKDFPFPNSSNVAVPLTRIQCNTLYAYLKEGVLGRRPLWTAQCKLDNEEEKEVSKVLTKYLDMLAVSPNDLDITRFADDVFQEGGLLGFQWTKVFWEKIQKKYKTRTEDGLYEDALVTVKDGPSVLACRPEDVLFSKLWPRVEYIPAFFFDVRLPWHIIKEREAQGIYDAEAVADLEAWASDQADANLVSEHERSGVELAPEDQWEVTEAHFYRDVDGDGVMEAVVFQMHMDSGIVLKQEYNTYGFNPWTCINFIQKPHRIEGTGIGQTVEFMQDEADATHNLRMDNMKVANIRMLAVKRGSPDVSPNEAMYPGKLLFLGDPQKDINPVQLGEVYPSSLQSENMTLMYANKALAMPSDMSGFPNAQLGSRDTARGQAQRLQQGQGILGSAIDNVIRGFSEIGRKVYYMLVRNRDIVLENERRRGRLDEDELEKLGMALSIPFEQIPMKVKIDVRVSDVEQTFESKRQNMMMLSQLYTQWASQTMPLAMQLYSEDAQKMMRQSPDLYNHMMSILLGSTRLLKQMFEFFGEEEYEDYLPNQRKQEAMLEMLEMMQNGVADQIEGGVRAIKNRRGNQSEGREGGAGAPGAGYGPDVRGEAAANQGQPGIRDNYENVGGAPEGPREEPY